MSTPVEIVTPSIVQGVCLAQLDYWAKTPRRSLFSWPMDGISSKPYGYTIHCSIVEAWNEEDRQTDLVEFTRSWLSNIDNVKQALSRKWD